MNDIKITETRSVRVKFQHDDIIYFVDWADDDDTIYIITQTGTERQTFSIPFEVLPTLQQVFKTIIEEKL
jgi:hypothetical protein